MEKEKQCPVSDDIDFLEDSIREVRDVLIDTLADDSIVRGKIKDAILLLNDILG